MKKLLTSVLLLASLLGFSQGFDKSVGTLNIQAMIGYQGEEPRYYNYWDGSHNWGGQPSNTSSSLVPGVMVSYDFGVHDLISVAPYFYFQHTQYKGTFYDVQTPGWANYYDNYKTSVNHFGFGARGLFHYGNLINGLSDIDQLDLYGGLALGSILKTYNHSTDSGREYFDTASEFIFAYDVFAGARWFFTDSFGANAEVGFGTSFARLGVTFKM
ncbi:hypothetical protein OAH12_01110 [Cyclobacteriaceae bacterium]|nr:hypothetical protein [Cyclobacteriaceae bacterium]